jgi:hypothetical protein
MIHRRVLLLPALTLLLTGCTDNMDSITRELRNCNNEAIDAMMMVTSEEQALRMTKRVLKPLQPRYSDIEEKLKSWESNRTKKEMVEETFKSNGFYLYIAELQVNKQRFGMEKARLRNLYKQYQKRKLDEMRAAGDNDPVITNPREVCPNLYDLVVNDTVLKNIESQLRDPKLKQIVGRFPDLKVDNYRELFDQEFKKRRETIKSDGIKLVD